MSDFNNSATMTFGYTNTDFTRKYKISDIANSDVAAIKSKILAINASLAAGTDGGLSDFFRSDDYDDSDGNLIVGKFSSIVAAQSDTSSVDILFGGE